MVAPKRLRFDDAVLSKLRGMQWSDDGKRGMISEQLDRSMYVALNKALEAMGGRWDKKAKAHVFDADPRSLVDGLLASGTIEVERDGFFETPKPVVLRMLDLMPFQKGMSILEPEAGKGAIALVLRAHGAQTGDLKLIEKNSDRVHTLRQNMFFAECADFMEYNIGGWQRVYMNPPFEDGQDMQHVMHAYDLLEKGGGLIAVMSEGVFFRDDKRATEFRAWKYKVGARNEKLPEGSFKASGTGVNTRLLWVTKKEDEPGKPAQLSLF